jgi:GT2 family glycosyltransferase
MIKQADGFFVTFFDDDFRPARDWLQHCRDAFLARPDVAALTGQVLADGAGGASLTSAEARGYVEGRIAPSKHWAGGDKERDAGSLYGCNMAFRASVVRYCRFEENLPLYGWQEDQDYTAQARAVGRTVYVPACKGVHLGCKSGRVSGTRFGSLADRQSTLSGAQGTMPAGKGARFVLRHLLANSARSLGRNTLVDYPRPP